MPLSEALPRAPVPASYPAIPDPSLDPKAMLETLKRVRENVELLTGHRGPGELSFPEGLALARKQIVTADKTITARMLDLNEIQVSADAALAQRTTLIEAEISTARGAFGTLSARITSVDTARVNADIVLAQRATNLEAEMTAARQGQPNLSARVTQVDQARVSGDAALASSVNSVSTTVAGHTATLTSHSSSINGLHLSFGVQGTIDGVTGGFIFTGIRRNDGAVTFGLIINSNVTINGNLVVDGTINYTKVVQNSISQVGFNFRPYPAVAGASVTISLRAGAKVIILAYWAGSSSAGGVVVGSPSQPTAPNNIFVNSALLTSLFPSYSLFSTHTHNSSANAQNVTHSTSYIVLDMSAASQYVVPANGVYTFTLGGGSLSLGSHLLILEVTR